MRPETRKMIPKNLLHPQIPDTRHETRDQRFETKDMSHGSKRARGSNSGRRQSTHIRQQVAPIAADKQKKKTQTAHPNAARGPSSGSKIRGPKHSPAFSEETGTDPPRRTVASRGVVPGFLAENEVAYPNPFFGYGAGPGKWGDIMGLASTVPTCQGER